MSEEQKSNEQKIEDEIERRVRKVIKERDEEKEKKENCEGYNYCNCDDNISCYGYN